MSIFTRKDNANYYEHLIDSVVRKLNVTEEGTDEYKELLSNLERLEKLNKEIFSRKLDPDKTLAVAGNLAGIITVLNFERLGVISSKAFSLIMKVR